MSKTFQLEIREPGRADVFLAAPTRAGRDVPWAVVERLDRAGIRVLGDPLPERPDAERLGQILRGCAGVVCDGPAAAARASEACPRPRLDLDADGADVEAFSAAVLEDAERLRAYAFFVGRLERDFRHAREAIRAAVETEAGIPCLWADDGRHTSNVDGVRERTRLLIKHATFVIADLTLGIESPDRENPSRAHEIGMAVAYERPLLVCSQEPRRYPYFSIGDMQMSFWLTEDELEAATRDWIALNRSAVARRVFNYRLPASAVARPVFTYDAAQSYVGPKTGLGLGAQRLRAAAGMKGS